VTRSLREGQADIRVAVVHVRHAAPKDAVVERAVERAASSGLGAKRQMDRRAGKGFRVLRRT
jgi:hypothetical protein